MAARGGGDGQGETTVVLGQAGELSDFTMVLNGLVISSLHGGAKKSEGKKRKKIGRNLSFCGCFLKWLVWILKQNIYVNGRMCLMFMCILQCPADSTVLVVPKLFSNFTRGAKTEIWSRF